MVTVLNAFSLSMLSDELTKLYIRRVPLEFARGLVARQAVDEEQHIKSYIGHADTARILSTLLGVEISINRGNFKGPGSYPVLVCQYNGPRLPEGATQLPEGAEFHFYTVTWMKVD